MFPSAVTERPSLADRSMLVWISLSFLVEMDEHGDTFAFWFLPSAFCLDYHAAMTSTLLADLLQTAELDARVLAVLLYGSEARGESRPDSDIDVCLVLAAEADSRGEGPQTQLDYLRFSSLDVRVFQRLPLHLRQRVLKDGKMLLVKNEDDLYEVAFRTVRAYEDFRPFYLEYLKQTANG